MDKYLSQDEVARRAKMTPSQLSQLETGLVKNPRLITLWRVSKAIGCSINDMYDEYDDPEELEE